MGERTAPVAAALAAVATLACCVPLGFAGAAGALGLSVLIDSARPWLLTMAVVLLATGLVQLYRGRNSCQRRSRLSLILFGVSASIVIGVLLFPQQIAELMASLPGSR